MKKTTTTTEPESASYDRLHKSALPRIAFGRCMASCFLTRSGQVRSVEAASVEEFTDLVASCKLPARNQRSRLALKSCLAGIDYRQKLDRWYCVCEILTAGGQLSLFATPEQARQSVKETLEVQSR